MRYIQIDDGYQPAMGDWLKTGNAFGGEVQTVLRQIRERGFEPAIWADTARAIGFSLARSHHARDFWTEEDLGRLNAGRHQLTLAPHAARLLMYTPAS